MSAPSSSEVTRLLLSWTDGDSEALNQLIPHVHQTLRRLAAKHLRGDRPNHTLQPTALVHEAYLRLIPRDDLHFESRNHFFGLCAQIMRQILVDDARRRRAGKRGAGQAAVPLDEARQADVWGYAPGSPEALLDLDAALTRLASESERQAKVVELRYFGGFTNEEVAGMLDISPTTALRDWTFARAWLQRQLSSSSHEG